MALHYFQNVPCIFKNNVLFLLLCERSFPVSKSHVVHTVAQVQCSLLNFLPGRFTHCWEGTFKPLLLWIAYLLLVLKVFTLQIKAFWYWVHARARARCILFLSSHCFLCLLNVFHLEPILPSADRHRDSTHSLWMAFAQTVFVNFLLF